MVDVTVASTNVWALLAANNGNKTKLKFYPKDDGSGVLITFWCPGCEETHTYDVGTRMELGEWGRMKGLPVRQDGWLFNGDLEYPTFSPSLKYDDCHLFVRRGIIEYCMDCKHEFKGEDIPLETF